MHKWCDDAGLGTCSAHGPRKASATLLAEAGATEHQPMAIFGWANSKKDQLYTKAAEERRIIDAGFERLAAHKKVPLSPRRFYRWDKRRK
jgi:hypothetical protein